MNREPDCPLGCGGTVLVQGVSDGHLYGVCRVCERDVRIKEESDELPTLES